MAEWHFQVDRSEELAELRFFSIKRRQTGGEVDFPIAMRETAAPLLLSLANS
jgi:hypothetical protein